MTYIIYILSLILLLTKILSGQDFQKSIAIESCKTPEEIAEKVLQIEHENFASTIHEYLTK